MGLLKRWGLFPVEPANQPPPKSWTAPRISCLIASIERTGSNLLDAAMSNTGSLGQPTEFFNVAIAKQRRWLRFISAAGLARVAKKNGTTENGITSIKFLPRQFRYAKKHLRLEEWFPNARWVTTRRKDRLGQAISLEIAHQTKVWSSLKQSDTVPVYSAGAILSRLEEIESGEAMWADYFAEWNIAPLHLWYEDLESDLGGAVEMVSRFVGVDPSDWRTPSPHSAEIIPIKKQRGRLNDEWRQRFLEDIRAAQERYCTSQNKVAGAGV
jgi:trehalose 2-sulfotransferase